MEKNTVTVRKSVEIGGFLGIHHFHICGHFLLVFRGGKLYHLHFSLYPSLIAMEIDSLVRFGYVFKGCICMLFATQSFCFEDRTTEAHNPVESWNRMGLVIDGQNVLCPNLYFGGTQFCHCQEFHHDQQHWAAAQIFV